MDSAAVKTRFAMPDPPSEFADTAALDIELPLRTRASDALGIQRVERRAEPRGPRAPDPPPPARVCTHLPLIDQLLAARPGPYGLDVEVKQDERVVGTWELDVSPRDAAGVYVSQARAALRVCVSAWGEARATGAFLVLSHWWVNAADSAQASHLYAELTAAVLVRLSSLTERMSDSAEPMPPYVLYLVDGRARKVKLFSLPRLASELLGALEGDQAVPGLTLQIAYGRGLAASPVAATMPADLPGPEQPPVARPLPATAPWSPAIRPRVGPGQVFVREQLSSENLKWYRKFVLEPS